MPTVFPAALDNFANPAAEDSLASHAPRSHSEMHADLNDAIEAVQREIGTNPNPAAGSLRASLGLLMGTGATGVYAGMVSAKDPAFGAKGDGVTDDTAAITAWQGAGGVQVVPNGNYIVTSIGARTRPYLMLADNAKEGGVELPFLAIGKEGFQTLPRNYVFVQQDTLDRVDASTVQIQRNVNSDIGQANPKALRVLTTKNHSNAGTEWAISGEITNYSNTASTGDCAVSGVGFKYGTASVFGGHFQANDYNVFAAATDVTPVVGAEFNTPAVGLDHPTANAGFGNRRCLDVIARTNRAPSNWNTGPGNFGEAEVGVGVDIRTDDTTLGYFRYGLTIREVAGNTNKIGTAAYINTTGAYGLRIVGANTTAALTIEGNANLGLLLSGTFTGPAIRVNSGQYIGMENTNTIKTAYGVTASVWGFYSGGNERVGFIMTASPGVRVAGNQIIGARDTGWAAMTGAGSKAAIAAAAAGTASGAYVQAELQGALNRIAALEARMKSYDAMLVAHGLIGP